MSKQTRLPWYFYLINDFVLFLVSLVLGLNGLDIVAVFSLLHLFLLKSRNVVKLEQYSLKATTLKLYFHCILTKQYEKFSIAFET